MLYSIVRSKRFFLLISNSKLPMFFFVFHLVQQTLTIRCYQFPLNISDSQCAQLQLTKNPILSNFDMKNQSELNLLILVDDLLSTSIIDLILDFNQLINSSFINRISLNLVSPYSDFTINNQTTTIYSSNDILIGVWKRSPTNSTFDIQDVIHLNTNEYKNDRSLCDWDDARWSQLFDQTIPYAYFLKINHTNLTFTLVNNETQQTLPPYLDVLYCYPYRLDSTALALIVSFSIIFLLFFVTMGVLHYLKREERRSRNATELIEDQESTDSDSSEEGKNT